MMGTHWSEQERQPGRSWSWSAPAAVLALVILLAQLPEVIFTVSHPSLRKGFEVQLAWMWLIATVVVVASVARRLLKARNHDRFP
jgi:hypothetical protein